MQRRTSGRGLVGLTLAVAALAGAGEARGQTLLVGYNFNNAASGSFNTTGTSEVYTPATGTLGPASTGLYASTSLIYLNGGQGNLAGPNNSATSTSFGTFAGTTVNAVNAAVAGQALAVVGSGNNNNYLTFQISTAGFESLVLTYAAQRTSTGFTTQAFSYSTDGGTTYTPFANVTSIPSAFATQTVDFSSVTALNNQASVLIRETFSGASSASGNTRMDNVQFVATAITPEPTTVLGLGALSLGAMRWVRRRKRA